MTRTLTAARVRQIARRARRAARHTTAAPAPMPKIDDSPDAIRRQLHDSRAYLGRLKTLTARTEERITRLDRALGRKDG